MNSFLKAWTFTITAIIAPLLLYYAFLVYVGEADITYVVKRMAHSKDMLFLSAIGQDTYDYKKGLHQIYEPTIVALGSSRAMQLRSELFNSSFLNWGGASGAIPDIKAVTNFMLSQKIKPQIAIIYVDVWWFNEKLGQNTTEAQIPPSFPSLPSWGLYKSSFSILLERKNKLHLLFKNPKGLGLSAKLDSVGFDAYGSMFLLMNTIRGEFYDANLKYTRDAIKDGKMPFIFGETASNGAIKAFLAMVSTLESKGIHTILIFPPFLSQAAELLNADHKHLYIQDLMKKFKNSHVKFYDYTNASVALGKNLDCEFIDGHHGGDVLYARIIRDIAKQDPILAHFIRKDFVDSFIHHRQGLALGIWTHNIDDKKEIDFLKLGCSKKYTEMADNQPNKAIFIR